MKLNNILRLTAVITIEAVIIALLLSAVELSYDSVAFNAKILNKEVILTWKAITDNDHCNYIIEKSKNGLSFSKLAVVGKLEKEKNKNEYSVIDKEIPSQTAYYRLSRVNSTGETDFTDIFALTNIDDRYQTCNVETNPNPCIGKCFLVFKNCSNRMKNTIHINLFDFIGNSVQTNYENNDRTTSLAFDVNNNLKPGILIIKNIPAAKGIDKK